MTREEAIKEMREKLPWLTEGTKRLVEALIPELAESEDERIRQEIISALKFANDGGVYDKHIAFLEKQKEHLTPEEKMNHPLYLEGFDIGKRVGEVTGKPAGWDKLQEEFRNINEAFEDGKKEVIEHPERYGFQKPTEWSEEDEDTYNQVYYLFRDARDDGD